MENMTLSDIAAVTGDGFRNGNAWPMFLLSALACNGGRFGNYGELGQFAATQNEILFGQQFQALDNKIDRLGNGIADATFALNNAIVNEGRAIQGQLANHNADSIAQHAAIKEAIHAEGEATRAMMQQDKIERLQAEVSELKTSNMMCGIPRISPYSYGVYPYECHRRHHHDD